MIQNTMVAGLIETSTEKLKEPWSFALREPVGGCM